MQPKATTKINCCAQTTTHSFLFRIAASWDAPMEKSTNDMLTLGAAYSRFLSYQGKLANAGRDNWRNQSSASSTFAGEVEESSWQLVNRVFGLTVTLENPVQFGRTGVNLIQRVLLPDFAA
jgi:hypothetical protein